MEHALYLTKDSLSEERTEEDLLLGDIHKFTLGDLWNLEKNYFGLDTLVVQPQYWNNIIFSFCIENHIKSLDLCDRIINTLFKDELEKFQTLTNLKFLNELTDLKYLKIDAYTSFFSKQPVIEVQDFTPVEGLNNLEYLSILDSSDKPTFVNINFSKLKNLKKANLQTIQENKTLYECVNLESIDTRYYEKDFTAILKLKNLNFFSAYCDNLESFEGIEDLSSLEDIKLDITPKLKELKNLQSDTVKIFYLYTETASKLKSLDGIEGLRVVEDIALNGYKNLESISNLSQCQTLKTLTFENCKVPDDIEQLSALKNLEKLTLDDCKEIKSLGFVKKLPNLKYLSFDGNTKITDGDLAFLKELNSKGVEIYFNDRKHYNFKFKDIVVPETSFYK